MRSTRPSFTAPNSQIEDHGRLERRRNRFANDSIPSTGKQIKPRTDPAEPLIGTCGKLEKGYLRLTSAPDRSTIRPLAVLERAFPFVMDKYRSNQDWSYASSQLKSIRQDLMVQCIRNDFTVLVYEENARIALEMGDRDQFVQCQTQLEILYDSGCDRTHLVEFLIYRLLYSLLLKDFQRVNRVLVEIDRVTQTDEVTITLQFCSAFRRKNYTQLFTLYQSLPKLTRHLVDLFIDIYRKQLLEVLIWGFSPTFPVEVVTTMLAYESSELCRAHLNSFGVKFLPDSLSIDCKTSRSTFSDG